MLISSHSISSSFNSFSVISLSLAFPFQEIPHPADRALGTGTSLPSIFLDLQASSVAIASAVKYPIILSI